MIFNLRYRNYRDLEFSITNNYEDVNRNIINFIINNSISTEKIIFKYFILISALYCIDLSEHDINNGNNGYNNNNGSTIVTRKTNRILYYIGLLK